MRYSLECVVLALHGDQHAIGGSQRIHREKAERGGAIDENVVKLPFNLTNDFPKSKFPISEGNQLYLGTRQIDRRWNNPQVTNSSASYNIKFMSILR